MHIIRMLQNSYTRIFLRYFLITVYHNNDYIYFIIVLISRLLYIINCGGIPFRVPIAGNRKNIQILF